MCGGTAALPAPLQDAIDGFAARHPETSQPAAIRDLCREYSCDFADELDLRGDVGDFEVISGLEVDGWFILNGHFAVRVDGLVIDWTYRQFDPQADVPRVTTLAEWRRQWIAAVDLFAERRAG